MSGQASSGHWTYPGKLGQQKGNIRQKFVIHSGKYRTKSKGKGEKVKSERLKGSYLDWQRTQAQEWRNILLVLEGWNFGNHCVLKEIQ